MLLAMATTPYMREMDRLNRVHRLGDQLNAFSDAAELFANNRAASIRNGQRVGRDRLVREGLLPDSFPETTPFGQTLEVRYDRDRYGNVTGIVYERGRTNPNSRYARLNDMAMESLKRQAAQYGQEKSDNTGFSRQFGYIPARKSIFHGLFSDFTYRMNGLAGSEPSASVLIAPPRVLAYAEDNPNEMGTGRAGKKVDESTKRAPHGADANDQGTPASGFFRDSPSDAVGHDTPGKRDKDVKSDTGERGIMVAGIGKEGAGTSNGYTPAGVPQAAGVYIPSDAPGMSLGGDVQTSRRAPFFWMGVALAIGAATLALAGLFFTFMSGLPMIAALLALALFAIMLILTVLITIGLQIAGIIAALLAFVILLALFILIVLMLILIALVVLVLDIVIVLAITAIAALIMLILPLIPLIFGLIWAIVSSVLGFLAVVYLGLSQLIWEMISVAPTLLNLTVKIGLDFTQVLGTFIPKVNTLVNQLAGAIRPLASALDGGLQAIMTVLKNLMDLVVIGILVFIIGIPIFGIGGIIPLIFKLIGGLLPSLGSIFLLLIYFVPDLVNSLGQMFMSLIWEALVVVQFEIDIGTCWHGCYNFLS
jgi:hypothetical protein